MRPMNEKPDQTTCDSSRGPISRVFGKDLKIRIEEQMIGFRVGRPTKYHIFSFTKARTIKNFTDASWKSLLLENIISIFVFSHCDQFRQQLFFLFTTKYS